MSAAVGGLLILLVAAVYLGRHRRAIFARTMSLLSHPGTRRPPNSQSNAPTTTDRTAPGRTCIASLLTNGASLTGPGGEGAARHMAVELLRRRQAVPTELVLSRPDAWRLFGMDIGTLQEDRIPGLILTDDHEQTRVILARQTSSRRLLLTYGNEGEALPGGRGHVPVLSISPRADGTTTISADGAVASTTELSPTDRLPLLTRGDAFDRLMSMPTCARHHDEMGDAKEHPAHDR
ncbi:hypothetical protein AB0C74_24050 [Spirillospora sp. NPDC048832]